MSKGGCDRWKRTRHRGRSPDAGAPGSTPAPEKAASQGQKPGALCPYLEFSLKGVVGAELAKGWMECAGMSVFPQHHPLPLRPPLHCSPTAEKPETHRVGTVPWTKTWARTCLGGRDGGEATSHCARPSAHADLRLGTASQRV